MSVALVFAAVVASILMAWMETLGWVLSGGVRSTRGRRVAEFASAGPFDLPARTPVLVYLDGMGRRGPRQSRDGGHLVAAIAEHLPQARIIVDIFPYGPTGVPLEQRRVTGVVWCIAKHVFPPLIWLRNLAQLPLLHLPVLGTAVRTQLALEVASRLTAVGHTPGRPVVLVGFSAGAHVAECIAGILVELCGGRVHRVHIAGVDRRPTAAPGCSIRVDSRADRICALVRVGLQRDITCGVEVMGVHHFGPEGWTSITPRASDGSVPVELAAAAVSSVVGQLVGEGSDGACANFTKSRDCSALAE